MSAEIIPMDELSVNDGGRVRLPSQVVNTFALDERDVVRVRLSDLDIRFSRPVDSRGRVRIPARLRENHGIEDGDEVDVELMM